MDARRVKAIIKYNNKNLNETIDPYLLSFSYSDNEEKADDIQITLEDRDSLWENGWYPKKGATIEAEIHLKNYDYPGQDEIIPCGVCELDSIGFSGPPSTISLKANSIPGTNTVNDSRPSKAWEKINFSSIVNEIASKNGLGVQLDINRDKFYDRIDQKEESDLSFLKRISKDLGLSLKVYDMKIVIVDDSKYFYKDSVYTIERGDMNLGNYGFNDTLLEAYGAAEVSYKDPSSGKTHKVKVDNQVNHGTSKVLKLNKRVENSAEARTLGTKELQDKNKKTRTASFTLSGKPLFCKQNIQVKGWYKNDGKYMINKATHSIGSGGYQVKIDCSKI